MIKITCPQESTNYYYFYSFGTHKMVPDPAEVDGWPLDDLEVILYIQGQSEGSGHVRMSVHRPGSYFVSSDLKVIYQCY